LLGCTGGLILQHLDPTLTMYMPGHRAPKALPSAQRPELFRLMRNERLLDELEGLLGPEITVSPSYHVNLKLAQRHIALAAKTAAQMNRRSPEDAPLWGFHVGTSQWHSDAAYGLPDCRRSQIVNVWIPLTPATLENSCLVVSPGSHRGLEPQPVITSESVIGKARPLPVKPGDVIFLDNNLPHNALENKTAEDFRWAFNFRYLPTGQPSGRPFLPEFVARSRVAPERELHDADLWRDMWRGALDHLSRNPLPPRFGLGPGEAQEITARWRKMTANYTDWLSL
jgi:ectoine hydroxylase-related dioxygenase (phytanoyl-CoA dioxygenase family)